MPAPKSPKQKPRKSRSGKSGRNLQPQRQLRAPAAFWALLDRAIAANAADPDVGGYAGWSGWARHHLAIAAADELGIDPLDALRQVKSEPAPLPRASRRP